MTRRHYSSIAPDIALTDVSGIAAGGPSSITFHVGASLTGWPSSYPYSISIDPDLSTAEILLVTSASGLAVTATRAQQGTTAYAHADGAVVRLVVIDQDFEDAAAHINASSGVHGTSGNVVGDTDTQTLVNKTLTSPTVNSPTINTPSIVGSGGALTLPAGPDTLVGRATTDTLTNKTLTSPKMATIVNTGTLTLPTSSDTLVGRATTDTLTNKTLTSPNMATIVNTGTLTLPTASDTLVGRATTDTLTNKTLTSPAINTPAISGSGGALTLPAGPDTLVGRATTDTLTNKTLTSPAINTPTITKGLAQNVATTDVPFAVNAVSATSADFFQVNYNGSTYWHVNNSANLACANGVQLDLSGASAVKAVILPSMNSYTPTFTGTGTSFALGNGSVAGSWIEIGNLVYVEITITAGSSTVWGTAGVMSIGFPKAAVGYPALDCLYVAATGGGWWTGRVTTNTLGASAGALQMYASSGAGAGAAGVTTSITSTVPATKATGDKIFVKGFYLATT